MGVIVYRNASNFELEPRIYLDIWYIQPKGSIPFAYGITYEPGPTSKNSLFRVRARVLSQAGTAYVTYENCIVPKKYLIGTENKGRIDHSHENFK